MGKTPYFTKVFIIGILVFTALYLAMGDMDFTGLGGPDYRYMPSTRNDTEAEIKAPEGNFVGNKEVEDFKHITLSSKPFKVSYITAEKSFIELESLAVESGLFSTNEYTRVFELTQDELNKMTTAALSGKADDTNLYGKLIVGLNGEEIYSGLLNPGESFEVSLNKTLFAERNEFLVTAESSGWRIWAPTVYRLESVKLESDFMGEVSQCFDFHVKEEQTPVNLGRIILNFDEINGPGRLLVRVNGELVFNATPNIIQWIEFSNIVKEGKNTVEMVSEKDTEFTVRDAKVIIFWDREASEELVMELDLSSSQRSKLPGEIKFKVEKVFGTPTSLVATIEDPDGDRHSLVAQGILDEGKTITIDLPRDYTGTGKNKIIFSVTGSGGYTITDFRVNL